MKLSPALYALSCLILYSAGIGTAIMLQPTFTEQVIAPTPLQGNNPIVCQPDTKPGTQLLQLIDRLHRTSPVPSTQVLAPPILLTFDTQNTPEAQDAPDGALDTQNQDPVVSYCPSRCPPRRRRLLRRLFRCRRF